LPQADATERKTLRNDIVKSKKLALLRNLCILVVSLLLVAAGVGCIYTDQLLNKIHYTDDGESQAPANPVFPDGNGNEAVPGGADVIGGLYHDDAITNILLLGVDDYQASDSGRSDSMMLISVDTRHKKLKVTSFMRDMYVAIPGIGSNKLNAAYSLGGGKVAGAKKVVTTIEANFGVDIDRFAFVNYKNFPKIIDRLGGVPITLTDKKDRYGRTEADLINIYSGDRNKVHTGENTLSGLQARYYARIRDIGDDQERTLRQRKLFESLVGKLKTASLPAIYSVLSDTLNLVTTNMTKDEVLSMASNSLTYLNYPVSQNRVPADGEYEGKSVYISQNSPPASVLVPDLEKCRKSLAQFIYEDDLPEQVSG
jgi:LCP family protein required for cell wall assembly